ncbi:GNAT family N-acetyltransferase [Oleiagrimonas sp. C23AA]|uniref:GNAT family N-acetyltransferase n=1 Tax=Oleiagrimonas sp. C23AA TaxID=2719047 RepID=UPI001424668D|nr:GNAT family N-acetyltransferase [Oleiagrimonas sp. C23AA]NII09853.1 GNAT family N-acetyltransferase [Oleiagrimonas sp. C23AA]
MKPLAGVQLETTTDWPAAEAKILSDGIVGFNRAARPDLEPVEAEQRFLVVARDGAGRVCGGLRARCFWNTLHIELMWVHQAQRGRGLGRDILAAAEDRAVSLGYALAHVETTSWQALTFYRKVGYALRYAMEGRPVGETSYYLSRSLPV